MDPLLTQIGLLLTEIRAAQRAFEAIELTTAGYSGGILPQVRAMRRALEAIERSTSRYNNGVLAQATAMGPRWGAPPIQDGALRVYVVNISDLAPGGGSFFESLLGGIGRFFGGLVGGVAGGVMSTVTLYWILRAVADIVSSLRAITTTMSQITTSLDRFSKSLDSVLARLTGRPAAAEGAPATPATPAGTGPSFFDRLPEFLPMINALTGLFTAASSGPDAVGAGASRAVTAIGESWQRTLNAVTPALTGISYLVNGLILLVPILTGAIATLFASLDDIKRGLLDLIQFLLRNVFLLRGAILVLLYDTIAGVARLAAAIIGIIREQVALMIPEIIGLVEHVLDLGVAVTGFLGEGLQRTVTGLMQWLADTLLSVMASIADSALVRTIIHILRVLPDILPSIREALPYGGHVSKAEQARLDRARTRPIDDPVLTTSGAGAIPTAPNLANTLVPQTAVNALHNSLRAAGEGIVENLNGIFRNLETTLTRVAQSVDAAARSTAGLSGEVGKRIDTVRANAATLADALTPPVGAAAADRAPNLLTRVAEAYERWLSGGGMTRLLGAMDAHFATSLTIPQTIVSGAGPPQPSTPRATVEIQELLIEIGTPSNSATTPTPVPLAPQIVGPPPVTVAEMLEEAEELEYRGYRPGMGPAIAFT